MRHRWWHRQTRWIYGTDVTLAGVTVVKARLCKKCGLHTVRTVRLVG